MYPAHHRRRPQYTFIPNRTRHTRHRVVFHITTRRRIDDIIPVTVYTTTHVRRNLRHRTLHVIPGRCDINIARVIHRDSTRIITTRRKRTHVTHILPRQTNTITTSLPEVASSPYPNDLPCSQAYSPAKAVHPPRLLAPQLNHRSHVYCNAVSFTRCKRNTTAPTVDEESTALFVRNKPPL